MAPGHLLPEAVIDEVLEQSTGDVRRGAVFGDADGSLDGCLWFLEGEARDGMNQIAGKRLFAVRESQTGQRRPVNSSILWDLKPASGSEVVHTIQHPAARLDPKEVVEIVRYVVWDWRGAVDGPPG